MVRSVIIVVFAGVTWLIIVCGVALAGESTCVSCHRGLEQASDAHKNCVDCHGGDSGAKEKDASHRTMYGPRNPSAPVFWRKTCGKCHFYQFQRVRSNIMSTNTGMIRNIQKTWEGEDGQYYGARNEKVFFANGFPVRLKGVSDLNNLSGELYRKFCSRCHTGIQTNGKYAANHSSGCAACHFPCNDTASYQGNDAAVKGKLPYSADHQLRALPGNDVCLRCHNRSGRIALSYQGLYDGNNSMVPTRNGLPGPRIISGLRNLTHITEDIHFLKGMDCIDCHTSRDVMGDSYAYKNMYLQTEITCKDCHGTGRTRPGFQKIDRENDEAIRESRNYHRRMKTGMKMITTGKNRKYSNVFYDNDAVYVLGKRSGKLHKSPLIKGTPEHTIPGHERMECYACHSRAVPQCYGCHTRYDETKTGRDYIKKRYTPGKFTETEDFRKLYPFPLAVNQRDKISPVTPGCQTFVTVINKTGRTVQKEYVSKFKGKRQLRFAPFYSHNTGQKAVNCSQCHGNPAFLGFGQNVVAGNTIQPTLICEKSKDKPLDGFMVMKKGKIRAFSAITRQNSRPLNSREIKKVLGVNQCLVCHNKPEDPIYQKKFNYKIPDDCLYRFNYKISMSSHLKVEGPLYKKNLKKKNIRFPVKSIQDSAYNAIYQQLMSTRANEKAFVNKTLGKNDPDFFQTNCGSCHVKSCLDCHEKDGNFITAPKSDRCLNCHKGYFTGWEFYGRAPREDSLRYQRGKTVKGESFLKMLPDVHAMADMECGDCHSMQSLMTGKKTSKTCRDCHKPDPSVIEHRIKTHLTNLECCACHSAWAAQEYGTFFIRFTDSTNKKYFRLRSMDSDRYVKSSFLKKQDSPPLGINLRGKVSPIRPQFIIYFTDIKNNHPVGKENRLLAARWKAFFPHTIRRGTVMCDGCHNNPQRFVMENKDTGIYKLRKNKMALASFWDQKGQTIANGMFMPPERFNKMASKTTEFKKAYVIKWKKFIRAVGN